MVFDCSTELGRNRAVQKFQFLFTGRKKIEIKEIRAKRSLSQNKYLHLIISWFALEYGETAEYIKQEIFKKQVNRDIFIFQFANKKTGEIRDEFRSTSDLDTKELTVAIERFRNWASKEGGIYLPEPKDLALLNEIEYQIKLNAEYL